MHFDEENPLVYTIKDLCRICYTCVRKCPAKAIKIEKGQAKILVSRCIACGNCVKVCSQGAKVYFRSVHRVESLLEKNDKVIACIAPSFIAEFREIEHYKYFVGALKKLGFYKVVEVGFGADLVASEYHKLYKDSNKGFINSDCPAVVYYVRQYYPEIVDRLAPIDSPAMALAKSLRKKYGSDIKLVFIGPCIAKKAESEQYEEVLTFAELRDLFKYKEIDIQAIEPSDFDPPYAAKGAIFPLSGGLYKTMGEDREIKLKVLIASGYRDFREALKEFANGNLESFHLELLACRGCLDGAGMTSKNSIFLKNQIIENYVKLKLDSFDKEQWEKDFNECSNLDFSRVFAPQDRRLKIPKEEEIQQLLRKMGKEKVKDYLNCGACGYDTCREHAIAVIQGLAEEEMCLPYTIERLHKVINKLEQTQEALIQSEKLASMGQLSAAIAHELNNPLGIITLYANILKDELVDNKQVENDLNLIVEQAERCKMIVGGLLNFARKKQVNLKQVELCQFLKKSLASVVIPRSIDIDFSCNLLNSLVYIDKEQMLQAITNILKNAVEAMGENGKLSLKAYDTQDDNIKIEISDTGPGIPYESLDKIFTPFFTTKKEKGTGLGLPLVYGIIKMHKGKIFVKSNTDPNKGPTGTNFIITLPRNPQQI